MTGHVQSAVQARRILKRFKMDRREEILKRYKEINDLLMNPDVARDTKRLIELQKELKSLKPVVEKIQEVEEVERRIDEDRRIVETEEDHEIVELAREELKELEEKYEVLKEELKLLLVPKDEADDKNAIVEIRAGTGGDEASLFAKDLFRMYTRYAEDKGWNIEMLNSHPTDIGGYKEVSFLVKGEGVYGRLKFESGVHRVQRIPVTESGGRIHTSTATVAVLPEIEEFEIDIDENEVKMEFYNASGPGGQNVNKVATAVRLTHIPTGIVVTCQDERSQFQNRVRAFSILRAKLYQMEKEKREREISLKRKSQIGTGERSEKIRTYNFPQNRVTDHRINLTLYSLDRILDGDLDPIIDKLLLTYMEERLNEKQGSAQTG